MSETVWSWGFTSYNNTLATKVNTSEGDACKVHKQYSMLIPILATRNCIESVEKLNSNHQPFGQSYSVRIHQQWT